MPIVLAVSIVAVSVVASAEVAFARKLLRIGRSASL